MFFFQLPYFPEYFLSFADYGSVDQTFKKNGTEDDIEAYKWSLSQPGE